MAVMIEGLSEMGKEMLRCFLASSINGNCYHLAIALHRGLGWPLAGVIEQGKIVHSGVKSPGGKIWDGRGEVSLTEFTKPFIEKSCDLKIISEEELARTGTVNEHMVEFYLEKSQLLWPDLPWKRDTVWQRMSAFAEDLEALSRKHRLWICAPYPTTWPVIFKGMDDEAGYQVRPSGDSNAFTINRMIR